MQAPTPPNQTATVEATQPAEKTPPPADALNEIIKGAFDLDQWKKEHNPDTIIASHVKRLQLHSHLATKSDEGIFIYGYGFHFQENTEETGALSKYESHKRYPPDYKAALSTKNGRALYYEWSNRKPFMLNCLLFHSVIDVATKYKRDHIQRENGRFHVLVAIGFPQGICCRVLPYMGLSTSSKLNSFLSRIIDPQELACRELERSMFNSELFSRDGCFSRFFEGFVLAMEEEGNKVTEKWRKNTTGIANQRLMEKEARREAKRRQWAAEREKNRLATPVSPVALTPEIKPPEETQAQEEEGMSIAEAEAVRAEITLFKQQHAEEMKSLRNQIILLTKNNAELYARLEEYAPKIQAAATKKRLLVVGLTGRQRAALEPTLVGLPAEVEHAEQDARSIPPGFEWCFVLRYNTSKTCQALCENSYTGKLTWVGGSASELLREIRAKCL